MVEACYRQLDRRPLGIEVSHNHDGNLGVILTKDYLRVYDLFDPVMPVLLGTQAIEGLPRDVTVAGDAALVARMGFGDDLTVVDMREPAAPVIASGVSFPGPGRRIASWGGVAYAAGVTWVYVIRLGEQGPEVVGHFKPGGVVTTIEAHVGRLLVASGRKLRLYDIGAPDQPHFMSEASLQKAGAAIVVHGNTVHVAEMKFADRVKCILGLACSRQGPAEVFVVGADGMLQKVAGYEADSRSLPYLRWAGDHALAIEGKGVVVLRVEPAQ